MEQVSLLAKNDDKSEESKERYSPPFIISFHAIPTVQTISERESFRAGLHKLKVEWERQQPRGTRATVDFVAMKSEFPRRPPSASLDVASQLERAETVNGRWLVKAMLATLALAGLALYLTVCLLFYQGQWQFVFFPNGPRNSAAGNNWLSGSWARRTRLPATARPTPESAASMAASSGLPISDHKFDFTEEGVARLDGWWIPVQTNGTNAESTWVVLFCPDGRSNLADNIGAFRAFHALGVSVFAFDYRGFGASQPEHPSQQKSYEDGAAAFRYLTATRHIDPARIVLYGAEVGAAVAVHVAKHSPQVAGIILENPQPSFAKQVKREQHIHLLPMWLIFSQRFAISRIMPSLNMPKLVIATAAKPEYPEGADAVYDEAIAPKRKIQVNASAAAPLYTQPEWRQAVEQFLNSLAAPSH
jgi:pimeloyl-ACP methyl ester carboxylesterase